MINPRSTVRHITGLLNGRLHHLSRPGVMAVFINVLYNVLFKDLPVTVPNVPAPIGLNLTNNPLVVSVLVKHFKRGIGLMACAAVDTGLVLHRIKLILFLTDIKVGTNRGFIRVMIRNSNMLCIKLNFLVAFVPLLVANVVTH